MGAQARGLLFQFDDAGLRPRSRLRGELRYGASLDGGKIFVSHLIDPPFEVVDEKQRSLCVLLVHVVEIGNLQHLARIAMSQDVLNPFRSDISVIGQFAQLVFEPGNVLGRGGPGSLS